MSVEIKEMLLEIFNRGLTVLLVSGGYTGREKNMLMMILSNQEYPIIIRLVEEIDNNSLVIAYNVSEVHGLGFTYQPIQ